MRTAGNRKAHRTTLILRRNHRSLHRGLMRVFVASGRGDKKSGAYSDGPAPVPRTARYHDYPMRSHFKARGGGVYQTEIAPVCPRHHSLKASRVVGDPTPGVEMLPAADRECASERKAVWARCGLSRQLRNSRLRRHGALVQIEPAQRTLRHAVE